MIPVQHIHPMVVHFPIVFLLTLAALDTISTLRGHAVSGRSGVGNASAGLAVLAGGSAILAFVLGDMALEIAEASGWRNEIAEIHEKLGMIMAAAAGTWALVRGFLWARPSVLGAWAGWLIVIVELGLAALVMATAYYGGQLVYSLGVNVDHLM